jgi:outer membrane protein
MNKIALFLAAAILFVSAGTANAQKTGYISLDEIVGLMPELRKVDSLLQRYQSDTINGEFASIVQEYNYKDSIMSSKDTLTIPANVKAQYRQDIQGLAYQIQNWQAIAQQAIQNKQSELLEPIYVKVMGALNAVAKENGYSYVYNKEVLLVAPPADNLLPLVAKKLNVKLPPANPAPGIKK